MAAIATLHTQINFLLPMGCVVSLVRSIKCLNIRRFKSNEKSWVDHSSRQFVASVVKDNNQNKTRIVKGS
jgi:hypothetical protein